MKECGECPGKQCKPFEAVRTETNSDRTIIRDEPISGCVAHRIHAENLPRVTQEHNHERYPNSV